MKTKPRGDVTARSGWLEAVGALVLAGGLLAGCSTGYQGVEGSPGAAGSGAPAPGSAESATVVVKPGETVTTIARANGVPARAIIEANHLPSPYVLYPGQALFVPGKAALQAKAPTQSVRARPVPPAAVKSAPSSAGPAVTARPKVAANVPATASTSAARSPSAVEVRPLAAPAQPPPSASPHSPTKAPAAAALVAAKPPPPPPRVTAAAKPSPAAPKPQQAAKADSTRIEAKALPAPKTEAPSTIQSGPKTAPPTEAALPAAKGAEDERLASLPPPESAPAKPDRFLWPVRGKVISAFGTKEGGLINDGINIAGSSGAPVRAAANGVVVYAGNEIRGFGNLVLVKHEHGWMTAYGHNDRNMVKRGDHVRRGQQIATVGSTGNVATPQLHFEIRRGSHPVDPAKYLPTESAAN